MTGDSAVTTAKPQRSDAVRTRAQLMRAAAGAFAEHGVEASISEIAERAGIAKGTVFRHFATKEDLLAAIVCDNMHLLVAAGQRLADSGDPGQALYEFMSTAAELQARDRAFCQVAHGAAQDHPDVRAGQAELDAVIEILTDRARRDGAIRPELTGQDVVLLISGIYQTAMPLQATHPELWRRFLRLTFDGMQATTAPPLPAAV
ncbi:TetR/AcrR family transcriptional regulator [Actinoplanes sp. CA-054009]